MLETVAHRSDGYPHSELSRKLGIPSSSCSYVLARLTRQHYLSRGADGRYTVGPKTLILAHAALRRMGFRPFAEPVLHQLTEETRLAANIGVLDGGRVLLVDRVESPDGGVQIPKELRDIGADLPAHTTGLGKVLLAGLDPPQLKKTLDEQGLVKITAQTIVSVRQLATELDRVRERGFATVQDEHYVGFWSVAAPICGADGKTRAAVSLTGGPRQAAWRDTDALADRLIAAAREISRNMRFRDIELTGPRRGADW